MELVNCAMILHLMLCRKHHPNEMSKVVEHNSEDCTYYLEGQLDNSWERPARKSWLEKTSQIMTLAGFEKEEDFRKFLSSILAIIDKINFLILSRGNRELIMSLISEAAKPGKAADLTKPTGALSGVSPTTH